MDDRGFLNATQVKNTPFLYLSPGGYPDLAGRLSDGPRASGGHLVRGVKKLA